MTTLPCSAHVQEPTRLPVAEGVYKHLQARSLFLAFRGRHSHTPWQFLAFEAGVRDWFAQTRREEKTEEKKPLPSFCMFEKLRDKVPPAPILYRHKSKTAEHPTHSGWKVSLEFWALKHADAHALLYHGRSVRAIDVISITDSDGRMMAPPRYYPRLQVSGILPTAYVLAHALCQLCCYMQNLTFYSSMEPAAWRPS